MEITFGFKFSFKGIHEIGRFWTFADVLLDSLHSLPLHELSDRSAVHHLQ